MKKSTIKKASSLILISAFIISASGCNFFTKSEQKNTVESNTVTSTSSTETEPTTVPTATIIDDVNTIHPFSEDLAWISYEENDISYWGCVNKSGEILFKFNDNEYNYNKDYYNGYAYLKSNDRTKLYVVDKEGSICSSYNLMIEDYDGHFTVTVTNSSEHAVAYGCGYTVVQTHNADFDSAYYLYTIYDANGNVIDTYKTETDKELNVYYCGKDVFYFDKTSEKRDFFFAKSKNWIVTEYYKNDDITFYDNYAFLQTNDKKSVFLDSDGTIKECEIPGGTNSQKINSIYDDVCLLINNYNGTLSTYDINTNSYYTLTNESYLSRIDWDNAENIIYNDNAIIVPLIGDDKKDYVTVFDKEWNVILEPFEASTFSLINDERFIIDNELVYDTKGNVVFNLSSYNMNSARDYYEGVTVANSSSYGNPYGQYLYSNLSFIFLDVDGNVLFENIHY